MFTMPLKEMKLRTRELESSFGASYGMVRKWNGALHHYTTFHQGWDLEASTGTPCYAVASGLITHVGDHAQWGLNIVLQFSRTGQTHASTTDALWAFYAHLQNVLVKTGNLVDAGQIIALSGHSGNASASAPHLHFEIRSTPKPSPGLGSPGRLDPATILGYKYLVCE